MLQHVAALLHDPDAQRRQPRRLDGSVEQLGAEFGLESLHLARYGGGRAMQAACRARDRSGFGKFNQCMNVQMRCQTRASRTTEAGPLESLVWSSRPRGFNFVDDPESLN